jgi:XTP/dITP diphosphohydrolase
VQLTGDQSEKFHSDEFLGVMLKLRAECEWKAAQTHRSLSRYLLEETYETLDAIDSGDPEHLREELGDLLLQVYFHAVIAAEAGEFTLDDVVAGITEKMIRRNPHVFGDAPGGNAFEINEAWEAIKATEKKRDSIFDGIPAELPALLYADKVLDRLQRSGGTPTPGLTDGLGERLLALVEEARAGGVDPEQALRDAVRLRVGHADRSQGQSPG